MKFLPAILAISLLAAKAKASGETETTAGNQDTMAMMSDTMPLSLDAGTINVVTEASQLRGDGVKKTSHLRGISSSWQCRCREFCSTVTDAAKQM